MYLYQEFPGQYFVHPEKLDSFSGKPCICLGFIESPTLVPIVDARIWELVLQQEPDAPYTGFEVRGYYDTE